MKQFNTDAALLRSDLDQMKSKLSAPALVSQWRELQFWFDNLIQNGTFDTATTYWNPSNAVISAVSGNLRVDDSANAGTDSRAYQYAETAVGRQFRFAFDRISTTSGFWFALGKQGQFNSEHYSGSLGATTGLYEYDFFSKVASTQVSLITESTGITEYDNVTLFETDGTDIIHRLPNGWEPTDVLVDGLLIREGAAHDYTVDGDGFDTWIKPAVAPGALTETCIKAVRKVQ